MHPTWYDLLINAILPFFAGALSATYLCMRAHKHDDKSDGLERFRTTSANCGIDQMSADEWLAVKRSQTGYKIDPVGEWPPPPPIERTSP